MQSTSFPSLISLQRPWHQRVLDLSMADAFRIVRSAWQQYVQRRRELQELAAVAEMNELLLRDIGAPDWMVAEAAARHDVERLQLNELRNEAGIGRLRGLL
jgi:hypothetical protein